MRGIFGAIMKRYVGTCLFRIYSSLVLVFRLALMAWAVHRKLKNEKARVLMVVPVAKKAGTSLLINSLLKSSRKPPCVCLFAYQKANIPIGARIVKKATARNAKANFIMGAVLGTLNFERYQIKLKGRTVSSEMANTTGKNDSFR
jgi:hypothetical protein